MKKYIFALSATSLSLFFNAQNHLTVRVSNLKNTTGVIEIGLYQSDKNFLKEGAQYAKKRVKVTTNPQTITFPNLPKGEYAVAIFHDENQNGKCDTNAFGIPKEGYGFSNNFRPKLSAPKFHQTKIWVENHKEIGVQMIR